MARLTAAARNALPDSDFAGPGRTYPDQDIRHGRNALSRAAQNASPALEARISAAVHRKYPSIGGGKAKAAAVKRLRSRR